MGTSDETSKAGPVWKGEHGGMWVCSCQRLYNHGPGRFCNNKKGEVTTFMLCTAGVSFYLTTSPLSLHLIVKVIHFNEWSLYVYIANYIMEAF